MGSERRQGTGAGGTAHHELLLAVGVAWKHAADEHAFTVAADLGGDEAAEAESRVREALDLPIRYGSVGQERDGGRSPSHAVKRGLQVLLSIEKAEHVEEDLEELGEAPGGPVGARTIGLAAVGKCAVFGREVEVSVAGDLLEALRAGDRLGVQKETEA